MDKYTQKTKIWLNERFKRCCEDGVYYAHQPIYGLHKGHSEESLIPRYIRTYQIMEALAHLKFDSLLDIGGAEGYKTYIVKRLFNARCTTSDLSEEACRRAKEIFCLKSITADIHDLPFRNNEFDVVLCSETLEHAADVNRAIDELLRVAKNAIVITVPHEDKAIIDSNIREEIPHGHIHSFDLDYFDFLMSRDHRIFYKKMISSLIELPSILMEAMRVEYSEKSRRPKIFHDVYNACVPILRRIFGPHIIALLIRLDSFICKFASSYQAILFIILKDKNLYMKKETKQISACRIINFRVPYYYLRDGQIKINDINY